MNSLAELKIAIRESDVQFFTDEELLFYLKENNYDYNATAYQCLVMKSENTGLNVSGLSTADTAKYFLRLASRYKPRNTGTLLGG